MKMSACRISRPAKSAVIDLLQIRGDLEAFNEAGLAYNVRCFSKQQYHDPLLKMDRTLAT